mgnify:CR=1 FL=1
MPRVSSYAAITGSVGDLYVIEGGTPRKATVALLVSAGGGLYKADGANNTLVLDVTNNRLGILTAAPEQPLHVAGGLRVSAAPILSAAMAPGVFGFETPIVRLYLGSGGGNSLAISTRNGGVTADNLTVSDTGIVNAAGSAARYSISGTKVVGARETGWTAATGTANKGAFATGSATLTNCAERIKAHEDALRTHGLIN